jgi:hypothetical protein
MGTRAWILLLAAAAVAAPAPVRARQEPAPACSMGRIASVQIDNGTIFDPGEVTRPARLEWAFRAANRLHSRTRPYVIRRELLFRAGDCFDPVVLRESERLLRALGLFSRVAVFAVPRDDARYDVVVDTRDDWSTEVDVRLRLADGVEFRGGSIQDYNVLGTGQTLGAYFMNREIERGWGVEYATPQLLATRWNLSAHAGRTLAGTRVSQEIAYPFLGEAGRWAVRQRFARDDEHFEYVPAAGRTADRVLLPQRSKSFDLTLVRRLGRHGSTTLVGAALGYEDMAFPGAPLLVPAGSYEDRTAPDTIADIARPQSTALSSIRIYGIVGQRNIVWVTRRGLDALRGEQDVAIGLDAVVALGRSLPALEAGDDLRGTLALYTGIDAGSVVIVGTGRLDGLRNQRASAADPEWEDVLLEAGVHTYFQSVQAPGHTLLLRLAAHGAWQTRRPFQLTLGGDRALRGLRPDQLPGGRRLMATLEHRVFFGWPLPDLFDAGGSVFMDAGRIWPGDVPWATDSGWRVAAGFGVRSGFPAGSRTNQRLDVAWPLGRGASLRDARVTFSIAELIGIGGRGGDLQFLRSRGEGIAGNLIGVSR